MWALAATAGVAAFAASGAAFVSDTGPTIYAIGLGIGVLLSAVAIWLRVGSTGGKRKEADWENKKARFDERFALEVEPSLRIAGVSGVGGLFEYRATTQTMREQQAEGRHRRDALEAKRSGEVGSGELVPRLKGQAKDLEAKLAGLGVEELCKRASGGTPPASELKASVHNELRRIEDLRRERDKLSEEQRQALASESVERSQYESLQSELDQAKRRVEGDPEDLRKQEDLLASEESALGDRIEELESATSDSADQAREQMRLQEELRDAARAKLGQRSEELTKAREARAQASTKYDATTERASGSMEFGDFEAALSKVRSALTDSRGDSHQSDDPIALDVSDAEAGEKESQRRLAALRERLANARDRSARLSDVFGGDADAALLSAEAARTEAEAALLNVDAPPVSGASSAAEEEATRAVQTLELEHRTQSGFFEKAQEAFAIAEKSVAAQEKELELRAKDVEGQDREALQRDVEKAQLAHDEMRVVAAVEEHDLKQAELVQRQRRSALDDANSRKINLEGRLEATGGAVLDERISAQDEKVTRARQDHQGLEEEYYGYRELLETLTRLDDKRTAHLGRLLARPVVHKFTELAGARYDGFELDASLKAQGVVAAGGLKNVGSLSVGTREQLASLVRLALAEHIGTAILLDDQLVHSDEARLNWFRGEVRRVADAGVQVIVFTCRPSDYLEESDLAPSPVSLDWEAGGLNAINFESTLS